MNSIRTAAIIATTLTTGLMAGLYLTFSIAVMPGLSATDDRTFVLAMRSMNIKILNGWFAIIFGGPIVLGILALVVVAVGSHKEALPWLIAAVVLYAATLAITFGINIPLNDKLEATKAIEEARKLFEDKWIRWNVVRTVVAIGSLGALVGALRAHP
ncbi:DUF1772 domain-containing protein [Luteipulveratus mongoliensis]|uniref:DUF1772 domain-containing protein n=1 Tax=Luteipulveratus mongoliensis TaxID=571913 RepID=A0A0K1JHW0_9MICO|nr:anthrone oxygenase family protein [Luteipulveratus mongoliensis]AKU16299.1 hypothetical protein VV02_11210 [Luteipulveratus mongoliensis]